MDFGLSEQQRMLRETFRDFLKKECPISLVREMKENKQDYSPELYRKMAQLGLLGMMIPPDYGGVGGNWVEMAIFYEEAGRVLLPSPHWATVVVCAQAILVFGTEEQKRSLLPKIAKGEIILTLALTEPEAGSNISLLTTTANTDRSDYVINGTKLFVRDASIADYIIAVARTSEAGITLFLVDTKSKGLVRIPLDTLGSNRLDEVVLENVRVPGTNILGELNNGSKVVQILDRAKVMSCAEMIGSAQAVLDMMVDYSKQRVAFGRPIGAFQALQHRMSDMMVSIYGTRWLVYQVAWMNSVGLPCDAESDMVQLQAGQVYPWITAEAMHMYGGVGLMVDHNINLYFNHAKAAQLNLGFLEDLKETIAQKLGL